MIEPTKILYFVFGLITLAGGIQGFITKSSWISLIAGGLLGIALVVGGWYLHTGKIQPGLIVGLVASVAIAGNFIPSFIKKGGWWPAGVEAALAVIAILISIIALVKK